MSKKRIEIDCSQVRSRVFKKIDYSERDFFYGADDRQLQKFTDGQFPARVKHIGHCHPIMIVGSRYGGKQVCPCSSGPAQKCYYSYIRQAAIKKTPFPVPEKPTYLIGVVSKICEGIAVPADRQACDIAPLAGI